MSAPIHGSVEPRFEQVRDVFARGFENSKELGASVCAYVDGHKVLDLWGGWADADKTREWQRDTIVTVYSATKGMTATCAHVLVDRGLLDVDEPVSTYWPEFAQSGKDKITVRMLLAHQAGLAVTTVPIPRNKRFDWDIMTTALARSAPGWEPGTRADYHGGTFGFLVGEVVRRIDGRPLDVFFRDEIAEPLEIDCMIALGPEDDHRCAEIVGDNEFPNTRQWRAAGDGASTGHASAEGLARMYAPLARGGEIDGVHLLHADTIEAATDEQPLVATDAPVENAFPGGLGYQLLWKLYPFGPYKPFGHTGMGGSIGLADPTTKLSFGFVMNKMFSGGAEAMLPALYACLRNT